MITEFLKDNWFWDILVIVIVIGIIRVRRRGYFWKAKDGQQLNFKEFKERFFKGVEGITPLQQTKTTLWSFPLIIGGTITGIIINIIHYTWWLVLILLGSMPIVLMNLVSQFQKFRSLKKVEEAMKEAEKNMGGGVNNERV